MSLPRTVSTRGRRRSRVARNPIRPEIVQWQWTRSQPRTDRTAFNQNPSRNMGTCNRANQLRAILVGIPPPYATRCQVAGNAYRKRRTRTPSSRSSRGIPRSWGATTSTSIP